MVKKTICIIFYCYFLVVSPASALTSDKALMTEYLNKRFVSINPTTSNNYILDFKSVVTVNLDSNCETAKYHGRTNTYCSSWKIYLNTGAIIVMTDSTNAVWIKMHEYHNFLKEHPEFLHVP